MPPQTLPLVSLLDREIESIESNITRSGWNDWIIRVALASLAWLFLKSLEDTHLRLLLVVQAAVLAYVAHDMLNMVQFSLLTTPHFRPAKRTFRHARGLYGDGLTHLLLVAVMNGAFLLASLWLAIAGNHLAWLVMGLGFLMMMSISLLILFFTTANAVTRDPASVEPMHGKQLAGVLIIPFVLGVSWLALSRDLQQPSIAELKAGLVIAAAAYLTLQLPRDHSNRQAVSRFHALRRELLLGTISPDAAEKQFASMIYGLSLPEALGDEVFNVIAKQEAQVQLMERAVTVVSEWRRIAKQNQESPGSFSPVQVEAVFQESVRAVNAAGDAKKDLDEALARLGKRLNHAVRYGAARQQDIDEVFGHLTSSTAELQARAEAAHALLEVELASDEVAPPRA